MNFESLASLWFGLSLPAILAMYLLKRKYIYTEVPSYLLWNRVLRELEANRPWQKLRNQLLMLLQLLIAALLVFALTQPFIWTQHQAKAHTVLVLDRSASMQATSGQQGQVAQAPSSETRLDQAKQQMLSWVRKEANNSELTLITIGAQPDMVLSRSTRLQELEDVLQTIEPYYGKTMYQETMSLAAALTREDPDSEIRLYTDGQWIDSLTVVEFSVPVYVEKPAVMNVENVSIVRFGVNHQSDVTKGVATIKNWGETEAEFNVSFYAGKTLAEVKKVSLDPAEQQSIFFESLSSADYYKVALDTNDSLTADNAAFAFASGEQRKTVLLVSDGNMFLEKALRLSNLDVIKASKNSSGERVVPRTAADFIVLDGVPAAELISTEWTRILTEKPVWYIHAFAGKPVAPPHTDYTFTDHSVTQFITFQDTHIASVQQFDAVPWGKTIAAIGNLPLMIAGEEGGQPRLAFTFHLQQSDLPLRSEFPILIQNAVGWLTKNLSANLGKSVAGEVRELAFHGTTAKAEWKPIDVVGQAAPFPVETVNGNMADKQTMPLIPGLFRLVETDASGEVVQTRYVEVGSDPRESNLAYMPKLQFPQSQQGAESADPSKPTVSADAGQPYPLMPWLIILVIAVVVVEWGVYQRGHSI